MPNNLKVPKALLTLALLSSGKAMGGERLIHADVLAKSGLPAEDVRELLSAKVLIVKAGDYYQVDMAQAKQVFFPNDEREFKEFVGWIRDLVGETTRVDLLTAKQMRLASQDIGQGN